MIDKIESNHAGQNNGSDETLCRILVELLALKAYTGDSLPSSRLYLI